MEAVDDMHAGQSQRAVACREMSVHLPSMR